MALRHRLGWDPLFIRRSGWFWPLAAAARDFEGSADWPTRAQLEAAYASLALGNGAEPLRFVENVRKQDVRSAEGLVLQRSYDGRIACSAEVPTRERDWHDFFNALCFMTFPRAKRALHRRQFRLLAERVAPGAQRLPSARTPEQDALTLFDEGGAVVAADPEAFPKLMAASTAGRLTVLAEATAAGAACVVPFGHALFEHLVEGLRCPGGSTRILCLPRVAAGDELVATVDSRLAADLEDPSQFREPRESAHVRLDALVAL